MLPTSIADMADTLAETDDDGVRADLLKRLARGLQGRPHTAAELLEDVASVNEPGAREEALTQVLGALLDEARMARENGQSQGGALIDLLETRLGQLVAEDGLSFRGRLALSSSWVRAGLQPPEALSSGTVEMPADLRDMELAGAEGLEDLLATLVASSEGVASHAHAMLAELLPTIPADARGALVRVAVAHPDTLFAELGCAWLLDPVAAVRLGAVEGLSDRLSADRLPAPVVARLTTIRSWVTDEAVRGRLDSLIRDAMRRGISPPLKGAGPRVHRVVASMVDGSGAQSLAAAVQAGSARHVAVVLLKEGLGVKDAYVVPCSSATEQKALVARMTDEIEAYEVALDYVADAIGLALSEGLDQGLAPVPGLVDVAHVCGLSEVRPLPARVSAILALADPEDRVGSLSVQARGRLVMASRYWEETYPILSSWFEDSDEMVETLEAATSRVSLSRGIWRVLEGRRDHWARVVARNALLLAAAGIEDAEEFVAVASALSEGRDLKKTPVMRHVADLSIEAWADRFDPHPEADDLQLALPIDPPPGIAAERAGELAEMLAPAGVSELWLDGFLTGICTAPRFVAPLDWVEPLMHLVGPFLQTEARMKRLVELVMLRYSDMLVRFRDGAPEDLVPADFRALPVWSDGYLTAWEATKPFWPTKALGRQGKAVRKMLEAATEGRIDSKGFSQTIPSWLAQRFDEQEG